MWTPPAWNRDTQAGYLEKHIDGTVKFNMSEFSNKDSRIPLMILPQKQLSRKGQPACVVVLVACIVG